jgi:hypothetical protein
MGHGQTSAVRINEASPDHERDYVVGTLDRIERQSGVCTTRWLGPWLGGELAHTLEMLSEAGVRYICDWINDAQPYTRDVGSPPLVSRPSSVQTNDVPAYFEMKASAPQFERTLKGDFEQL